MHTHHRFFLCSILIAAVGTLLLIGPADAGGDNQTVPTPKVIQTEQVALLPGQSADVEDDGKLRIIIFGAHPDDAEYKNGGTAAKWAKLGHHVKLVSVTNGDIGHWNMAGGPLAKRRTAEVKAAAKILGVTSQVLDIHDGELIPSLEYRRTITRLIRNWKADIVISHRPWDYHPDHRYVGILVQDAAFMVTVPFFTPDTPHLKKNPVFLYSSDRFQKPYPFQPDMVVAVDDVFEQKLDAINELVSQAYEGGAGGSEERLSRVPPESDPQGRRAWLKDRWSNRQQSVANRYRQELIRLYGEEQGRRVKYAEAFEICEYGRQPSAGELKKLFPFFGE
ncbi:MAG: PIG-L family deacetylase [Planctomycetes bacterium]|nr:PIG-L family deacetylase [Planctomycetota bacterium]